MSATGEKQPITRKLYDWEIEELRPIFGDTMNYNRVEVKENTSLTNFIDDIGRMLKGMEARTVAHNNAIGFGNAAVFPIKLPDKLKDIADEAEGMMMTWLIHELTHVWQFQHMGWAYLWQAIHAQITLGSKVYDYGGWEGLREKREQGWTLFDFNVEQQATIIQDYYTLKRKGQSTKSWDPYIQDIKDANVKLAAKAEPDRDKISPPRGGAAPAREPGTSSRRGGGSDN